MRFAGSRASGPQRRLAGRRSAGPRSAGPRFGRLRNRGPLTKGAAALLALALLSIGGWALYDWLRPDRTCASGVNRRGGECVGVTDGGFSFAGNLDEVSARIKAENDSAARAPHVSLAIMIPMTAAEPFEQRKVLSEVQGMYLAQYRANHRSNDQTPKIRLLLANPGRDHTYWPEVSDDLARRAATKENLRAVVAFNVSVRATQQAIARLTNERHIPVVGGAVTAGDIGNSAAHPDAYKGFVRVLPTTRDQAAALKYFNEDKGMDPKRSLVVEDLRQDDNYTVTLKRAFHELTKGAPRAPEQYRSPADFSKEGSTSNDFHQMVNTICNSPARDIYFAGRPVQLRQFINELGTRACTDKQYRVVSGYAASTLSSDEKLNWDALRGGVSVEYASVAHPDAWTSPNAPATGGSKAAYEQLSDLAAEAAHKPVGPVGRVELTDSRAVTTHDAAWTAITAIRNNSRNGSGAVPSLDQVRNAWLRLHGADKVEGASGWICLDNYGNPYDKAVPVVRLDPRTRSVAFVGHAWPEGGKPPAEDCTARGD
ncbi:ABC transporter substrate-binding protein [Streptomyces sp. NPDC057654]|uniref:ABC transporter substrate-binding protein n=1 Tax=Streptomyces sp. NPDC057654 TaxID=3346196 RepID=UPI0036C29CB6